MEVSKNTNLFHIENKSPQVLSVTVEYLHYIEEIMPDSSFQILVEADNNTNLASFFLVQYYANALVIVLNYNISISDLYRVTILVDDNCVYEQTL